MSGHAAAPGVRVIQVTPPASVNRRRGAHWGTVRREKLQLERDITMLLLAAKVPRPIPTGRVHATAVVYYPKARTRDEGNVRAPLEKALGDALVKGGWLADDSPDQFTFGELTFEVGAGPPLACVTLSWTLSYQETGV